MLHNLYRYNISCDRCGEWITDEHAYVESEAQALSDAKENGWKIENDKHLCPDCQSEQEETEATP